MKSYTSRLSVSLIIKNSKYSYQYFNTKAIFLAMELKNLSPKKSFVTLSLNLFKVLK